MMSPCDDAIPIGRSCWTSHDGALWLYSPLERPPPWPSGCRRSLGSRSSSGIARRHTPGSSAAAPRGCADWRVQGPRPPVGAGQCPAHQCADAGARSRVPDPECPCPAARAPAACHPSVGPRLRAAGSAGGWPPAGLDVPSAGLDPGRDGGPDRDQSADRAAGLFRARRFPRASRGMTVTGASSIRTKPPSWPVGTAGVAMGRICSARSAAKVFVARMVSWPCMSGACARPKGSHPGHAIALSRGLR